MYVPAVCQSIDRTGHHMLQDRVLSVPHLSQPYHTALTAPEGAANLGSALCLIYSGVHIVCNVDA